MKLFLLAFLTACSLMAADALEAARKLGVESNYTAAVAKAKKEKKMLIMVIVKENCHWCDKIVNRTLGDAAVRKRLKKDFVTLIVDKDDPFPADFKENFFPSIFYIDTVTQKSVYENVGYVGTKCFLNDLDGALKTRNELYAKE